MTRLQTVADFQALARAVTDLLPAAPPLTATLETRGPVVDTLDAEFHVATVQFVGQMDTRLLLAVSGSVVAPLAESGLDIGGSNGLQILLDSIAPTLGQGVIVSQQVPLAAFESPSTVFFSLRTGTNLHGWFALTNQEVTAMFDQENSGSAPADQVVKNGQANVLGHSAQGQTDAKSMRMLYDVEMTLTAEIGRAKLPVRQILDLSPGAIVELDRVAGSAADLMVNGHLVARGEVVVVDEDYGLRITEIMDAAEGLV